MSASLGLRIKQARQHAQMRQSELASTLNAHEKSVSRWENGGSRPDARTLEDLAEVTGVTYQWLSTGEGTMEAPTPPTRIAAPDPIPAGPDVVIYPYAPHGHKGGWNGRSNTGMEGTEVIALSRSFLIARLGRIPDPARTYWTHLVGESMLPWLRDGQLIGIEITSEIRDGGRYALYLDDAEEEIVKRVTRLGGKRLRLAADNAAYGSQEIEHLEEDTYRDVARGHTFQMRVLGRVFEPPDDAQAIFATAIAAVRSLVP